jgi:Fic family protein
MYSFELTEGIRGDLVRLDELRVSLDAQPLFRVWLGRTRRELEAEAVAASTSMEGVAVTVDEVRHILAGDRPASVSSENAALVEGYRDAMNFVLRRADDPHFQWQTELVLGIHYRVLAEDYSHGAGRFRTTQNRLVDALARRQVYLPPSPESVPELVGELAGSLRAVDLAAPVTAALVHVRLAGIHPFSDGNGRTARILSSLAMHRGGFVRPEFTSLEEWWGRHREDYYAAFACLGTAWDPRTDVTPFVEAHVRAQTCQVEALSLRLAVERRLWLVLEELVRHDLRADPRMANALYDAVLAREVTNRYYRDLADVSVPTATNDLVRMNAGGLLRALGAGRTRRYVAGPRLIPLVAQFAGLPESIVDPAEPLESQRDSVLVGLAEMIRAQGESPL